ncbi:guanylate kinase [Haloactinopolyspora alba]|uniref:Guanylate kinase n=1 Tax=Haloactinopolyspora alba TaxID=648780 RepID=A0A2P8E2D9_9ACTN|nr:guanylate kinase [Haloactinopolyspora alba]PSL03623.1 guanylate kinase [Haloactinopolyspora alba]
MSLHTSNPRSAPRVVVLSGPTAVGKTTVVKRLRAAHPELWISVSTTTRPARPREVDGQHYHFVDDATFDRMVEQDAFLEWAVVHREARYGTPRAPVEAALAEGRSVLLEIDLQGARQVRETVPDALYVFLAPPSWEEMVRRLVGRGTESEAERERRLATAREELAAESEFDVTLVNTEVEEVCRKLVDLMSSPHLTHTSGSPSTRPEA